MKQSLERNTSRLSHLDIPGGGQIVVQDGYAYVGHMKPPFGTSIIDVSDPCKPKIVSTIDVGSRWSHTHKVRVAGDIMITNVEQDRSNRPTIRTSTVNDSKQHHTLRGFQRCRERQQNCGKGKHTDPRDRSEKHTSDDAENKNAEGEWIAE